MYSIIPTVNYPTVSFGKYKCQSITKLLADFNYCQWLVQQDWIHTPKCPADIRKYVDVRDRVLRAHPSLVQLVPAQFASTLPSDVLLRNSNVYTTQHSGSETETDSSTDEVEWNSEEELMTDQETDQDEDSQVYIVDKVLDHEQRPDGMFYLIKWQGYPSSENTHEHERDISTDLLAVYWKNKYFEVINGNNDIKPWDELPTYEERESNAEESEEVESDDEPVQVVNSGMNSPQFQDADYINVHSITHPVEPTAPLRRSARLQAKRPAW